MFIPILSYRSYPPQPTAERPFIILLERHYLYSVQPRFTLVSFLELPCTRLHRTRHHTLKNRYENDSEEDQIKTSHKLLHALRLTTVGIEKFSIKHCKTGTASYFFMKIQIISSACFLVFFMV